MPDVVAQIVLIFIIFPSFVCLYYARVGRVVEPSHFFLSALSVFVVFISNFVVL